MNKIKRVSTIFRIIFQTAFLMLPIFLILFWIYTPFFTKLNNSTLGLSISFIPHGTIILHPLNAMTKLWGFIISLIPIAVIELILYFLIKLFRCYEREEIFSSHTVRYIKNIGYTMLVGQLLNPIYQGLITAALTWDNPKGQRVAFINFGGTNFAVIFTAFLIILVSWIMAEADRLHEEHKYTI